MNAIQTIHAQIQEISQRRTELWHLLSHGRDESVIAEIRSLDEQLAGLWAAHRAERARIRFGEREEIVKRARAEERLERAA